MVALPWIDAGRTRKERAIYTGFTGRMNDVALNGQIFINKLSRVGVIGKNAAHLCGGQKNDVDFFFSKKLIDGA